MQSQKIAAARDLELRIRLARLLEEVERDRAPLPPPATRRELRRRAGLSQEAVAELLGVTRVAVSRWEAGLRQPRRRYRAAYREILEMLAAAAPEEAAPPGPEENELNRALAAKAEEFSAPPEVRAPPRSSRSGGRDV